MGTSLTSRGSRWWSWCQFTRQELDAMFSVYGDFDSVDIVKSFGRIKTMAYVLYSNVRARNVALSWVRSIAEH